MSPQPSDRVRALLLAALLNLPVYSAGAAITHTNNAFHITGANHSITLSETNGAILSMGTGVTSLASSGDGGLWTLSYTTNGSGGKLGDLNAGAFSASSLSNTFQWSLSPASNLLYLTYSNADVVVAVTLSNREDGVDLSAAVTPRRTNVLALVLPAPLRFDPESLQRFIAPSHSSDGVGMAYNRTYFEAQDPDQPASWKDASVGPGGYISLYGSGLTFGTNNAPVPLIFTTNGASWLGSTLSNKWSAATAVVNRPPAPGQADIVLLDSTEGAFLSGSHLGGGPGAGYLLRIGGSPIDESRAELSMDVIGGTIEHLAQTAGGRTNVALISLVRGPAIGSVWPSSVTVDAWRERLRSSQPLSSNGLQVVELANMPELLAALAGTNYLAILNPYGELLPVSLDGGVPGTVTNIGNFVRAGGHWIEVAGHPFYQTLAPELYYTNNLLYPPAFADFFQLESTNGHVALYGVQPVPADPWSGQTNPATLFIPGQLVWGGDTLGGWWQRAFNTHVSTGQTWQSPSVRLAFGQAAGDALQDYAQANGFTRSLADKMPAPLLDKFKQSVMVHYKGGATQLTARLSLLPTPALLHFEEYLYGGFDKQYPDHLPPNTNFGTVAEFTNFLAQARQSGRLTMPYTNPTFWGEDPRSPTFLASGDAPLLRNPDGSVSYEEYFGNGGFTVTPWHPTVQAANRNTRNQFITNYPVDLLFQDQVGARTWQYDFNTSSPSPSAYISGLAAIAGEDSQSIPLSTENGYDRLINHEAQFSGLAWGLAPTTNAPVWRRYLRDRYAPSTWEIFPLAQYLAHSKLSFIYNNLSAAVQNHETMAWTLGLGYGMTYVIHADELLDDDKRQWLLWVDRVQKSVAAKYVGQGISTFSHQWGAGGTNPANGVIAASYGPVSVLANLSPQPLSTNGWSLPGHGYLATASGLVAGRLIAPGSSNALAYVAETNTTGGINFWIYSEGGLNARLVLPSGITGNVEVQVETNTPAAATVVTNVLEFTLPASIQTRLWSGTITPAGQTTYLIDFGRHNGTDGNATISPDLNGNYWNNLSPLFPATNNVATNGTQLLNLVSATNGASSLGLVLTTSWQSNGRLNGGLTNPAAALLGELAITNATEDYFFTQTSSGFKLTGLNTSAVYDLTFFGTRDSTTTRISTYSSGIYTASLTTSGTGIGAGGANQNNNTTAVLRAIAPDSAGEIPVTLTVGTGGFAYMGILKFDERIPSAPGNNNPGILVSPTSLSSTCTLGGTNPASQYFGITNIGGSTLNFTVATNSNWVSVAPVTGSLAPGAGQQITVNINQAGLSAGVSNTTITVSDPAATNSPATVSLTLLISNAPPTLVTEQVILVDFGNDSSYNGASVLNPDANGSYWNSIWSGAYAANLEDVSNQVTTVDIGFDLATGTDKFNGPAGQIDSIALGLLGGATNAVNDYYVSSRFQIQGLNTSRTYRLTFFGSHKFSTDTSTVYSICSDSAYSQVVASVTLPVQSLSTPSLHNSNTVAITDQLTPPANGVFYVKFEGNRGNAGYLNAMMIEAVAYISSTNGPGIHASPASLNFVATNGAPNPPSQSFGLTNTGNATLNYTLSTNAAWLSVTPSSGSLAPGAGQEITVSARSTNLATGLSQALITISDPAATNHPRTVSVSLNVKSGIPAFAIFGSSVAKGWASSGHTSGVTTNGSWTNSYSAFITALLTQQDGFYVTNTSIPGENTASAVARFASAVTPLAPDQVLIAYSLGNEGFAGTSGSTASAIVSNFTLNLQNLVGQCRSNGFAPIVGSVYPRGDYTADNYTRLKQTHLAINSWDVPSLNLLTPLDDGNGRWVNGFWADSAHPNDAGYLEFFRAFVPTLPAALMAGKTNSPVLGSGTNFARLGYSPGANAPLQFTPSNPVHSFTMSFRLRTQATGTIATVRSGAAFSSLEIRSNQLAYIQRSGAETVVATNLADGVWHDVALSSRYALSNTVIYLDGVTVASIPERYQPDQFVLGGPDGSGRAGTPDLIDLQNWCVYRAGWTVDEAQAQKSGNLQQSSMEIGAMLDDQAFTNSAPAHNRAQSLSAALVNTTNLQPWNTGLVDAPKLLIFGSSVAKGFHGPGSPGYTNGSYLLGYAGLLTPVVESSGWVVTNASIGGNDTAAALARFDTDAVPLDPDVILIGLSLGNEGLATSPDSAAVYESFRSGITNLIHRSRAEGFYPVLALVYPHTLFDAGDYGYVQQMNLLMNSWDLPGINLLGPVDNGAGQWAAGYRNDDAHPNPAGHAEMFYAIVPTLFDAIKAGLTNTPQLAGTIGHARLQGTASPPLAFTPDRTMHSFTTAFRVRSSHTGTVAAVMTVTGAPPVTSPATFLVDFGRHDGGVNGTATASPDLYGNYWNNFSPANPATNNVVALGASLTNLVTISNEPTSARLEITSSGWAANGKLNGGLLSPSNSLLGGFAVATATEDYFFHSTTGSFKIAGLNPSSTYDLRFFGSRQSAETRITTFAAGALATNLQTSGTNIGVYAVNQNDSQIALLPGIQPDANGEISVTVARAGLSFAHMGILEIKEIPGASTAAGGSIELRDNAIAYVSTNGTEILAPVDGNKGAWFDVALSHSYARGLTLLYVDGVLAGTVPERLVPVQFVLGGAGNLAGRQPAPTVLDLQDWCVYRAPWTTAEALAQHREQFQQASMEVALPLHDTAFVSGTPASNRAQSLAQALVIGTNLMPGLVTAPPTGLYATSPAPNTVYLAWTDLSGSESAYVVEQRLASSSAYWTTVTNLPANTTSQVVNGLSGDATYEFRVSAIESSLQGDYAGPASVFVADPVVVDGNSYYREWAAQHFNLFADTYLIDFNAAQTADYGSVTWNTVTNLSSTAPYQLANTNGNSESGYRLILEQGFQAFRDGNGNPLAGFDDDAQGSLFAITQGLARVQLTNLNRRATYDALVLARRNPTVAGFDYRANYAFLGSVSNAAFEINAASNIQPIRVYGLRPDASRRLRLEMSPPAAPTGTAFAVLNLISLRELNGPGPFLLDFNTVANPAYPAGETWNTITGLTSATPYTLVDSSGSSSAGVSFTLNDGFDQFRADNGDLPGGFCTTAEQSCFGLRDDIPLGAAMTFSGLDTNLLYDLVFLARRGSLAAGFDYSGTYTITGETATVIVVDAATNRAFTEILGIAPSAAGTINLGIAAGPGTGTDFPVINLLRLSQAGPRTSNPAAAGHKGDPDGDGLSNLGEYGMNQNPTAADGNAFAIAAASLAAASSTINLQYNRFKPASQIAYALQSTTNLLPAVWQTAAGAVETVLSDDGSNQVIRLQAPATGRGLFLRLGAEFQP